MHHLKSRRPIARLLKNLGVRSRRLNRMKFALIVLVPLPDSWAEFLSDNKKLPPIARPSLTCQTTADHPWLLLFIPTQVLPLTYFSSDFSSIWLSKPLIRQAMGRRPNALCNDHMVCIYAFIMRDCWHLDNGETEILKRLIKNLVLRLFMHMEHWFIMILDWWWLVWQSWSPSF